MCFPRINVYRLAMSYVVAEMMEEEYLKILQSNSNKCVGCNGINFLDNHRYCLMKIAVDQIDTLFWDLFQFIDEEVINEVAFKAVGCINDEKPYMTKNSLLVLVF